MHTGCVLHHQTTTHLFPEHQVEASSCISYLLQTSSWKCHQAAASGLGQLLNSGIQQKGIHHTFNITWLPDHFLVQSWTFFFPSLYNWYAIHLRVGLVYLLLSSPRPDWSSMTAFHQPPKQLWQDLILVWHLWFLHQCYPQTGICFCPTAHFCLTSVSPQQD